MKITQSAQTLGLSGPIAAANVSDVVDELRLLAKESKSKVTLSILEDAVIRPPTLAALKSQISILKQEGFQINLLIEDKDLENDGKRELSTGKIVNLKTDYLYKLGKGSVNLFQEVKDIGKFINSIFKEVKYCFYYPGSFRIKETISQVDQTGFFAIGICSLVTFLIGIVIAYLMGNQLQNYGANIFVVDGVAIAMCRELSPILVSIVVAGRSGSAFAAQLGSMKLNQETDALEVLGLRTTQVLVVPRIVGLMISLPFLVIIGDIFGILGGMFISNIHLDVGYANFIERLNMVLKPKQIIIGLIKAPIFALFIAAIGCKLGLDCEPNATSIGRNTTRTVVQSIVSVILLNAAFAILFTNLGL